MVDLSSVWVFYNLSVGAPETINVKELETPSTVAQPESTTMVGLLCNIYYDPLEKGGTVSRLVSLLVCRPSVVRSISFEPFT